MKVTEHGFNRFVAAGQWSSSWFIASAFLLVLLAVDLPKELVTGFVFTISILAPMFLVIGMYQCWKLPDRRRWIAIPASLFLILSGVMMFSAVVEQDRARTGKAMLETVHASAAWKVAQGEFDAAMKSYNILADRVFPADFPKRFEENEAAKKEQWATVVEKSKALKALEPAVSIEAKTAFYIFGADWAWAVQSVFLALYAIVNEAIALALSYRGKISASRIASSDSGETQSKRNKPPTFGVDEYLSEAERLGEDGQLAGYREVAKATGQTHYRCRGLLEEAKDQGKIERVPGERAARRKEA